MSPKSKSLGELKPLESAQLHLHYLDHFMRVEENEELQSEQRIKYFIALVTGSITIFSALNKIGVSGDFPFITLSVFLLVLFFLGLFVFARVIWSDRTIKQHRELRNLSYKEIKKIDPSVGCYGIRLEEMDDTRIVTLLRIFKGTLTQIMWITEGILISGFVFVLGISREWPLCLVIVSTVVTTIVVLLVLFYWSQYVKKGIARE